MADSTNNTARFYTGTYEQYLESQRAYGFTPVSKEIFESWQEEDRRRYGHVDENRDEAMLEELKRVLHPRRFSGMSPKMGAVVGYVLDIKVTDPAIEDMVITSDNCILAQHEGDCGYNDFIGHNDDLKDNWTRMLDAAAAMKPGSDPLTPELRTEAERLFVQRIRRV